MTYLLTVHNQMLDLKAQHFFMRIGVATCVGFPSSFTKIFL
jgi:hypothetical protein